MKKKFEGIFTVMLTPLTEGGKIDRDGIRHLADFLIKGGVHGIVALGSNGEQPYLTMDEKKEVVDAAADAVNGRIPLIVGTGAMGTDETVSLTKYAADAGADGAMVALSLYYPLEFELVKKHYEGIAAKVDLPVLYYNFPDCTRLKLSPEDIAKIMQIKNVAGAKETILNLREIEELIKLCPEKSIFTGTSMNLLEVMKMGGAGAICPVPNLNPGLAVSLYNAIREGKTEEAKELRNRLLVIIPIMAMSKTPQAILKEAMRLMGHPITNLVKSPLPQIKKEESDKVKNFLLKTGLLEQ